MRFARIAVLFGVGFALNAGAQTATRWHLDGKGGIAWDVAANDLHQDELEMSGQRVSVLLRYGVQAGGASLLQFHLVYPWLRTIPNNTNGSLDADMGSTCCRMGRPGNRAGEQQ